MRPTVFSAGLLLQFLRKNRIATLPQLKQLLGTQADITVFRKLKELSYRTSYSHRGSLMSVACGRSTRFGFLVTEPWWRPWNPASLRPQLAISLPNWKKSSRCQLRNRCCDWSNRAGSAARPSPAYICTVPVTLAPGSSNNERGKYCGNRPALRPLGPRPMNFARRLSYLPACSTNSSGVCTLAWNRCSWVETVRSPTFSIWIRTRWPRADGNC